jgi:hypothetical protein
MSRFIKNGPDKEMKNAREVRETILTLHEDELDNALWINDLHIVPMTREAEPEIPHEVGAGQLEMFLDLVCSLSTTSAAFFLDITYNELSEDEKALRGTDRTRRDHQRRQMGHRCLHSQAIPPRRTRC